jgi:carboxyl-terminal processing protease
MQPGDAILAIDGAPAAALGFEGAVERIRGAEGSVVQLSVRRGAGEPYELAVPRRRIQR